MANKFVTSPNHLLRGAILGFTISVVPLLFFSIKLNLFTIQDYSDLNLYDLDGNEVDTSAFDSHPLAVNYWATWCKPCIKEFSSFENAKKRFGKDITFVMISDDPAGKVKRFLKHKNYSFLFLVSKRPINLSVRPVTYFYGVNRISSYKFIGEVDSSTLRKKIASIK